MDAFDKMGKTFQNQFQNTMNANSKTQQEIGTITDALELKLRRFPTAIPKGDYLIDKRLAINYEPDTEVITSVSNSHSHTVKIPLTKGVSQIKAGDKVLVCWVGFDPVIVAVVVNGNDIGKEI